MEKIFYFEEQSKLTMFKMNTMEQSEKQLNQSKRIIYSFFFFLIIFHIKV